MQPAFKPVYGDKPFAVMGAAEGKRVYKWGVAHSQCEQHSDLPVLRDLLLAHGGWRVLKEAALRRAEQLNDRLAMDLTNRTRAANLIALAVRGKQAVRGKKASADELERRRSRARRSRATRVLDSLWRCRPKTGQVLLTLTCFLAILYAILTHLELIATRAHAARLQLDKAALVEHLSAEYTCWEKLSRMEVEAAGLHGLLGSEERGTGTAH